jgi:hypothetical protein
MIKVIRNISLTYNRASKNEEKEHVIDVFNFLEIPVENGSSIDLWKLIQVYLNKITVQSEHHPSIPKLASDLHYLKDREGKTDKFKSICYEFSQLFPNITFDVMLPDNKASENQGSREYLIKITESTGSSSTFGLDDSASGYYEALFLLYEKWWNKDNVLILDEPAVRLHPNVIRHLGRILSVSERQIILVTHSPYFIDVSMLGRGRKLVYFKRENNKATQIFSKSSIRIKTYIFDPDIFFSRCIILVEGASDAACFYAISDALNSVFERYNMHVVDSVGVGNVDPYIELASAYKIPYVGMVDKHYRGETAQSLDFYILPEKLEHELSSIGMKIQTRRSIDPEVAYRMVFNGMQENNTKDKIQTNTIGKVFSRAIRRIHENPHKIWNLKT